MRGKVEVYVIIFILGFFMVASSFAENIGVPELPAQYYGKVISSTPLNGYIEAKIGDKTYGTIEVVNNTFGGPTYLDGKLLVYAPGQEGREVKFYLNGSTLLNSKDTVKYQSGDVRYVELYYEATTDHLSSGGKGPSVDKIREFVARAEVIVGSEIDLNLSARYLKTEVELVDKPIEIKKDCILTGGPVANPVVRKYLDKFPVKVTNEYPGKHKGVIEITEINGYTVVLLAGSDRWGTKAAVEYFKTLEDLP
ncbi:MAG TPA: S-layer protein, partial [Methanococcaceae archaeon]|nr:S-layer protein [Methanococcaceae archaeon]